MRPWLAAAIAAVAVFALVSPSPAQSLAEVAARTKKKQAEDKAAKPAAKVYTESDLHGRPGAGSMSQMDGPVAVVASPAPGAAGALGAVPPAGEKPKTEDEERAEKQAEWRERLQKAEADVARISEEIDRAQTALNDISGPLYGGTRAGLITRVDEGKRQLAIAQQTVVDIQEEGRRARYK
jgi:cell pole-organizing protein PopZ